MADYSADSIQVLQGLGGVRRRPGMYVGNTDDGSGLLHMVLELVGNSIDQHLAGHVTELWVAMSDDGWISIRDDGSGIPTDLLPLRHDEPPISLLEHVFTRLHMGPTFDGHVPHVHVSTGVQGFGVAVVSALSERVIVETTYKGVRWTQTFERGERVTPLLRLGPTAREGTTVRFRPDPLIFKNVELDRRGTEARLQELAWLSPQLRVFWNERRLRARGGIAGLTQQIAAERGDVQFRYALKQTVGDVHVEIAFAWNRDGEEVVRSYVNMQPTLGNGTHVSGIWRGLAEYARSRNALARRARHVREAVGRGLVAVVHVGLYDPRFGSPTRDQLQNPEAADAVRTALRTTLVERQYYAWDVRRFLDERLHVANGTA